MTIGDYMETGDVQKIQKAKDDFVDYVVSLEETLDKAEDYGRAGDIRMLTVLAELNDVEEDLKYFAKRANEPIPMRNYHSEVGKLIREYLAGILEKEIGGVKTSMADGEDTIEEATSRLNQLEHIIEFYAELYPELDLGGWEKEIEALRAKLSE